MKREVSFVNSLLSTLQRLAGPQWQPSESAPRVSGREFADLYWRADDGTSHHERVEFSSTSTKGMWEILRSRPLPLCLKVHIARRSSTPVPAEVEHCSETAAGYRLGVRILHPERRRFERQPVHLQATLDWSSSSGGKKVEEVVVRNLSPGGVQVELRCQVPVQSLVRLSRGDYRQLGLTRYCDPIGDKYRIGIQFTGEPYHKDAAESRD